MFLSIEEMKDVICSYQMNEISEGDDQIIENAIHASVSEVRAYFTASNQKKWQDGRPKFDIKKIFTAEGKERDPWVLRMCKTVALWNICELSNVDIIYDQVKERYKTVIQTLEKIAGIGDYKDSSMITPDLPTLEIDQSSIDTKLFRFGSRIKFNHE